MTRSDTRFYMSANCTILRSSLSFWYVLIRTIACVILAAAYLLTAHFFVLTVAYLLIAQFFASHIYFLSLVATSLVTTYVLVLQFCFWLVNPNATPNHIFPCSLISFLTRCNCHFCEHSNRIFLPSSFYLSLFQTFFSTLYLSCLDWSWYIWWCRLFILTCRFTFLSHPLDLVLFDGPIYSFWATVNSRFVL